MIGRCRWRNYCSIKSFPSRDQRCEIGTRIDDGIDGKRYAIAEFRMPKAMSPSGAWEDIQDYYMPKDDGCHT